MKISILTPSYNQGAFIEKNIQSVMNQNYADFEHIIIDGGSTDNTIDVLRQYPHLKWVSEPDEGQADALNKGFAMATGDIVGWINSDDYYEDDIFQDVLSHFQDASVKWIIGNITSIYVGTSVTNIIQSKRVTYESLLRNPDILKQQGVFFRNEILAQNGGWNKNLFMVMDFDLWIRLAKQYAPKMIPQNYAYFLWHADQKSSPKNTIRQIAELNKILESHGAKRSDRYKITLKKSYYLLKSIIKSVLITVGLLDEKLATIPLSVYRKNNI